MSDESVYVITIPAMRNETLKCLRGEQVAILYWRSSEEVEDFLIKWNIPGEITKLSYSHFAEVCEDEGFTYVEPDFGPNEVFALKYEYLSQDTEYYRAFLEASFNNTKNMLIDGKPKTHTEEGRNALTSMARVCSSVLLAWGVCYCLLVIGVKLLGWS
jgi:hypothetical protein